MPILAAACALLTIIQPLAAQAPIVSGARDPAYASDGRLALSVRGDLWVVLPDGRWQRVTSGAAWDREPAWSADGRSLIYSSNADGSFDLWRIALRTDGSPVGAPAKLARGAGPN
ncbi:MAG TPA: hypothetical protein VJU87_06845, partial [Gemmatimonadaceae bacterium]|nr:hypothetical protein [Gemmatimonadaceae bacterium]